MAGCGSMEMCTSHDGLSQAVHAIKVKGVGRVCHAGMEQAVCVCGFGYAPHVCFDGRESKINSF